MRFCAQACLGLYFAYGSSMCIFACMSQSVCLDVYVYERAHSTGVQALCRHTPGGGRGFILCVWGCGRLPPALLTSPYPRGPPGRARLCKTEARPGEAPEEWPPGDWPGLLCPRCSSLSSTPSPHSRAACPVQSPVSLHLRALTRAGATHPDVPVALAPPPVLPPLSNGAWYLPPPSMRLLVTSVSS